MNNKIIVGIVAIAALAAAGAVYLINTPNTQPVAAQPKLAPTPQEPKRHTVIRDLPAPGAIPDAPNPTIKPAPAIKIVAPPAALTNSDATTQEAIADLSSDLPKWLTPEEQLRKWVLMVENAAKNNVLIKNQPLLFDAAPLQVNKQGNTTYLANNSNRSETLVDALTAINPAVLAHYYQAWSPLLEQAYSELGQEGTFHSRLITALDNAISIDPHAATGAELVQPSVFYKFANPELESASDLDKFFWRLGPESATKLQAYLKNLEALIQ